VSIIRFVWLRQGAFKFRPAYEGFCIPCLIMVNSGGVCI